MNLSKELNVIQFTSFQYVIHTWILLPPKIYKLKIKNCFENSKIQRITAVTKIHPSCIVPTAMCYSMLKSTIFLLRTLPSIKSSDISINLLYLLTSCIKLPKITCCKQKNYSPQVSKWGFIPSPAITKVYLWSYKTAIIEICGQSWGSNIYAFISLRNFLP